MAELATIGTIASIAASAAGGAMTYGAARQQAAAAKATGEYNAKELERAAAEERAKAGRAAQESRAKAERVMSRQRAVAATSGAGGAETEGMGDLFSETASRAQYISDLDLAAGESSARGLESRAEASRWKGGMEADAATARGTAGLVKAGFDIAATGASKWDASKKQTPDDLVYEEYGDLVNGGWSTQARRTGRRGYYY